MTSERLSDVQEKRKRVRDFLTQRGFDAVVLKRQDDFAWITAGGDSHVVLCWEAGFGNLVITRDNQHLIAYTQDYPRLMEEELAGQGYEGTCCTWNGPSPDQEAQRLTRGMRVASDFDLPGAQNINAELQLLHYPLTPFDVARYREIGKECDAMLCHIAGRVRPGMTERQIAGIVFEVYTERGYIVDVCLVGADERIAKYRHPVPSDKRLEKVLLIHPAARKGGLHANITRMLSFGPPPEPNRDAFAAASAIHASVALNLRPGVSFARILEIEKEIYAKLGYPDEWTKHFQGGITGYMLGDAAVCLDPSRVVDVRQAFDYFLTVTGAKCEELLILDGGPAEIVSVGDWPLWDVETPYGMMRQPAMMQI